MIDLDRFEKAYRELRVWRERHASAVVSLGDRAHLNAVENVPGMTHEEAKAAWFAYLARLGHLR